MNEILLNKFLDIFRNNILPLTTKGVEAGNKIFGAAIINKEDYSMIIAGSNFIFLTAYALISLSCPASFGFCMLISIFNLSASTLNIGSFK